MADLYPTFDVPTFAQTNSTESEIVKSALFDFNIGDFATTVGGKMIKTDEKTAWINWCIKAVSTERGSRLGYSEDYGVEMEQAMQEPNRKARESAIERTINEALMADPYGRTLYVRNFVFDWATDSVNVTFEVGHIDQINATLEVNISA